MSGRISFIGAGPGAADLITLRGARRIAEADIVVWSPTVVDADCVREHATAEAELIDCSRVGHEQILDVYRRAAVKKLSVVRLHSGDATLWGAVQEQYDAAQKIGLEVEIVPGVSTLSAAAAAAGRELGPVSAAAPVVLTRPEGDTGALPDGEKLRELAAHGGTMAVALSAARTEQLVEELRAGGYAEDTPVVVAYKTSWPDELLVQTTLGELLGTVKEHKLWRQTLFLIGQVLRAGGQRARLYQPGTRPATSYRRSDFTARRAERLAAGQPPEAVVEAEADTPATPNTWWSGRDQLESTRSSRAGARYRTGASKRAAAAAATRSGQVTLALHDEQNRAAKPGPATNSAATNGTATNGVSTNSPAAAGSNGAGSNGAATAGMNGAATATSSVHAAHPTGTGQTGNGFAGADQTGTGYGQTSNGFASAGRTGAATPAATAPGAKTTAAQQVPAHHGTAPAIERPQADTPAGTPRIETVKVAVEVEAPRTESQAATPAQPAMKASTAGKPAAGKNKAKSTATRRTKRTPRSS
ncbi:cobalt-precorrin-4/precorrin-4 C(11)-methyltransferase [Crossiella cryophila]|uniref:Precorrin-4/cobalt-precorrin-4 C11-methyltransferase n=1 Tax=Crossiella cryophila TaxID=43355 RepID=A0A7W7G076_9PSEU|nr:cobalt-precorrin-4/precorrin-4 C(11)-methyltransferase [Crossiella cryophila]MBB4681939.1 precorrin-4/cobalt-precorrin-4 C11-methyltransferase [Crossiella cryophila]